MAPPDLKKNPDSIDGRPTKNFFLSVLVKDVLLEDAILDLIDNSVDGARRTSGKNKYQGHTVKIETCKNHFLIEDNCGGIDIETAQKYAFRFGRDKDFRPQGLGMIGEFGVGMKRALFKMGRKITVESTTRTEYFKILIDVDQWLQREEWDFAFSVQKTGLKNKPTDCGTRVKVEDLYSGVRDEFTSEVFVNRLVLLVEDKQVENIEAGLEITVSDHKAKSTAFTLKSSSKDLRPIFIEKRMSAQDAKGRRASVGIRIYAGVTESDPNRAGWYVSCNGRTIIAADKSERTGWDYNESRGRVPAYHNQYSRFRGYVFFESDNTNVLPWNTTKTGVDTDHPIYRAVKLDMVGAMISVFSYLNALDREKESTSKALTSAYSQMPSVKLHAITRKSAKFTWKPTKETQEIEKLRWIKYQKREEELQKVMDLLGVEKQDEAGSRTFDYYLNVEGK